LRRLKWIGGFGGALRTDGPGFCAHAITGSSHALDFALFAPLRIILELLIVKEQLFAGGKDEVITAIRTFQDLVDEVHTRPPEHALEFSSISVDEALNWLRLTNQLIHLQFDKFSSHSPAPGMRGEMVP
jgi:hypothetical protein